MKKLLIVIVLLIATARISCSQSLRVTRFAEEEGLPSSLIKSVVRDGNGILWAASDDGLIRFDGFEFKLFSHELPDNYVKSLCLTGDGGILVSTDMGVSLVTDVSGVTSFRTIARGALKQTDTAMWYPKMFFQDQQKRIWLSDNHKLYRFNGRNFRAYALGPEVATNDYNRSFSFADDGNGRLFAFAETGVTFIYNEKNDTFSPVKGLPRLQGIHAAYNISPGIILVATRDGVFELKTAEIFTNPGLRKISDLGVSYFARNKKGHVFAGTWTNGLFRLKTGLNGLVQFGQVQQYAEKDVNQIYIDSENNLWIASDTGIFLLQESLFGSPFSGLTDSYIQCLSQGNNREVYFTDGASVFISIDSSGLAAKELFRTTSFVLQVIPVKEGFWLADAAGNIMLVSPSGKLLRKFDFSSSGKAIFKMILDGQGNLWACQDMNQQLICILPDLTSRLYGEAEGLASRIISLSVNSSGELFAGGMTDNAFLLMYNRFIDKFINLSERVDFERNIDINVNDIACVPGSTDLYLGTSFGLIRLKGGMYSRVNLGEFTGNSIKAIAIDSLGYVWFANNQGLHRYRNGDLMSFNERMGLPSKNVAYRGLMVDGRNRLWVGTLSGIAVSAPLKLPSRTLSPNIRYFAVNNNQLAYKQGQLISINNKSFLNLQLASPEFPAKYITYERLIEGLDSAWIPLPSDGRISLGGIEPGEYRIYVRARQAGNYIHSIPFKGVIEITRIWYERWWVVSLMLLTLFMVFRIGLRRHSRKLRSDNEKLEEIIRQRTAEIVHQRDQIEEQNSRILQKNEDLSHKNLELEQAKSQAEAASIAKSQFLSVMSHEIRTPMNAVIGATNLLMRDNPRPDQLEDLKILKFSADNLLGIINDILDLNKIEAGKLVIESIDFNLKNLAEGVYASMLHKAKEKKIDFRFEYDPRLPLFILSDPLRIAQILNNLVSNAIKFTEKGGVLLEVLLSGKQEEMLDIEFRVSDTGIGIEAEMFDEIFAAFTQASSDTSRKFGGTGLGLAITSRLLEMLGSTIRLQSEPGEGSTFSFVLHVSESLRNQAEPADRDSSAGSGRKFEGQHILLVEDNKINAIIARKFMEEWNLKVDVAFDGLQAIGKLDQGNYHLILMDLQMPGMDGYKTTSIIRSRGAEPFLSIPVIALTASSKAEVQEKISQAGMNDYVSKPFDPEELHSKLSAYL
ncbi:MAG: response regulator [Bacteroidales bacterium]|nr:response regulator [Bacteroidales bacterium]